jgi:hypothetical protein
VAIAEATSKPLGVVETRKVYRMATWKDVRPEDLEAYRQAFIIKEAGGSR